MRIVGGIFRSRSLLEFKGKDVRPTSDMARESLFNIIKDKVVGANFLDLFCGTGAVGIEALSRGAEKVTFNDASKDSVSLTKKNLEKADKEKISTSKNTVFFNLDAEKFLSSTQEEFDVIFIDAPYNSSYVKSVLKLSSRALKSDGIIVYEDEKPIEYLDGELTAYSVRKYGRAVFTFFKKGEI